MGWALHLHLIAAIAWIGGSIFMFVLGISMRDKKAQQSVYPHIGPIFGYFEAAALVILLASGLTMLWQYHLYDALVDMTLHNKMIDALRIKLAIVAFVIVATVIHFVIALKTNGKERTPVQQLLSRASSMLIFILNLFILHYAMIIRDIL
jgi:uncharacterized membrane protein